METQEQSIIIAITGGIGAGKSTVAEIFRSEGYTVISLDDKAKDLMNKNDKIKEQIILELGAKAYKDDGTANTAYISEAVFGNSQQHESNLLKLNSIVHPYVIQEMIDDLEELTESGESPVFVESALIFEADLSEGFDYIIVVDCDYEIATERITKRNGITREAASARMRSQIPREEKVKSADFVITNNGSIDELQKAVGFISGLINALPPKKFEILHEE